MKRLRVITLVIICVLLLGTTSVFAVSATDSKEDEANKNVNAVQNGAVSITNYDFEATVSKSHSYSVVEKITAELPDDTQSIDFVLPSGNFRIRGIKVENTDYQAKKGSESKVTIVDKDKLTKGTHTYTIEYTVHEFVERDTSRDIFFFDVLQSSWKQPINNVNIKVTFPDDFPWDDMQYYAGQFGVQPEDTKIKFKADKATHTVAIKGSKIPENFGITLKAELPDGYWEGALDGKWALNAMLIVMAAAVAIMLELWLIGGKDPKFAKVVQDKPIEGISVVETGYIVRGHVHIREIVALIVDMATKGYLQISEYEPRKYRLVRKEHPVNEEKFIRNAYDILFEDVEKDRAVDMDMLGPRLRRIKNEITTDIESGFSDKDMVAFTSISRTFRIISTVLIGIAIGLTCALINSYLYLSINYPEAIIVGVAAAAFIGLASFCFDQQFYSDGSDGNIQMAICLGVYAAVAVYVAVRIISSTGSFIVGIAVLVLALLGGWLVMIMRARARGNAALESRYRCLRDFIYHPIPKNIAANTIEDPNYYYEVLPYALLFNGLEAWAISFLTVPVPEATWYADDIEGHAFSNLRDQATVLDTARDIKIFYRTMISAYNNMIKMHRGQKNV